MAEVLIPMKISHQTQCKLLTTIFSRLQMDSVDIFCSVLLSLTFTLLLQKKQILKAFMILQGRSALRLPVPLLV